MIGIALLVAAAWAFGFRAAPRLDAGEALRLAGEAVAGFAGTRVDLAADGRAALVHGADGRTVLVRGHGNRWVVRPVPPAALRHDAGAVVVDLGEPLFPTTIFAPAAPRIAA
ncbi:hypothetical protein IP88_15680 [alpha proteobacterium AAP81b]|nr:hypothetical protein IP88_15680 [alpha proteobacterium AAP81b]